MSTKIKPEMKKKIIKGTKKGLGSILLIVMGALSSLLINPDSTQESKIGAFVKAQAKVLLKEVLKEESPAFKEEIRIIVREEIQPLDNKVSDMEHRTILEITEKAVSAYGKIFTIQDLKDNPSNSINIKMGLQVESCDIVLTTMDRERTILFKKYFNLSD